MAEQATTFLGVDSYIELYTTVFGWYQYNNLWDILTNTGLVFLPFFGLVVNTFIETFPSQQEGSASYTAMKRLEFNLILMFTVIVLAGQPLVPLNMSELRFIELCKHSDGQYHDKGITVAKDTSAYKKLASSGVSNVKDEQSRVALGQHINTNVPVWWYGVMSISSGITYAAKKAVPCRDDLKMTHSAIKAIYIDDPVFRDELRSFIRSCYVPTLRDFEKYRQFFKMPQSGLSKNLEAVSSKILDTEYKGLFRSIDTVPTSHTRWIGSTLFTEMNGHYFYRGRPVPARKQPVKSGGFVIPTCYDWWMGKKDEDKGLDIPGLRPRLVGIMDQYVIDKNKFIAQGVANHRTLTSMLANPFTDIESVVKQVPSYVVEDYILSLWVPVDIDLSSGPLYKNINDANSYSFSSFLKGMGGLMGSFAVWIEKWPMIDIARAAAPIVLAFILMAFYFLIPIGLVFSGYSLSFLMFASVGIFAIKFMSYFFHVAWWIEQNLLTVIGVSSGGLIAKMLIPLTIGTIYFMVPVVFLSMLAWANFHLGQELDGAMEEMGGENSQLAEAGATGVRMIKLGIDIVLNVVAAMTGGAAKAIAIGLKTINRST